MGEMADYNIEQGEEMLTLHQMGECGLVVGQCQYCEEEYLEEAKTDGE